MSPVTTQFVVSRDFVERRDNCSDIALFAIGGIALSRATLGELEQTLSTDIAGWNPFDNLNVQTQSVDDRIGADSWRFASAIGAALSALEDA